MNNPAASRPADPPIYDIWFRSTLTRLSATADRGIFKYSMRYADIVHDAYLELDLRNAHALGYYHISWFPRTPGQPPRLHYSRDPPTYAEQEVEQFLIETTALEDVAARQLVVRGVPFRCGGCSNRIVTLGAWERHWCRVVRIGGDLPGGCRGS